MGPYSNNSLILIIYLSYKALTPTLMRLQGTKSPDYRQLLERKAVITKQLQQNQQKENEESICS